MEYTVEMILRSPSGYCMPFEETDKDVTLSLGYGEQTHPVTGEKFFHHGIDFPASHRLLAAVASGTVTAVGSDRTHGICQTIRYGKYEVTYGHLANVYAAFGQSVQAGDPVSLSGRLLHMEVTFDGEELDPLEFLTMLYGNLKAVNASDSRMQEDVEGTGIRTCYDKDRQEIETLMLRFLPRYLDDLRHGLYASPQRTEQSLRNLFTQAAARNYFFEAVPSMYNPLGIGRRALPLACKVQELLIADFLDYLASRLGVFLSTADDEVKKKVREQDLAADGTIDPLAGLDIDVQHFDIPRIVSVYPDRAGVRWWTKAWFNNRDEGEPSVEITRQAAILFLHDRIDKDGWLEEHFPKQMEVYHRAIEQTREQLISMKN